MMARLAMRGLKWNSSVFLIQIAWNSSAKASSYSDKSNNSYIRFTVVSLLKFHFRSNISVHIVIIQFVLLGLYRHGAPFCLFAVWGS